MKNILTIAAGCGHAASPVDGAEYIAQGRDEPFKEYLRRLIKQSSGKYIFLCGRETDEEQVRTLVSLVSKGGSDVYAFCGGIAVKSSLVRGADRDRADDLFLLECYALMSAKSASGDAFEYAAADSGEFCDRTEQFTALLSAFSSCKAKLAQEVYRLLSEMLCGGLSVYYISALLALRKKILPIESMEKLDGALGAEVVLALNVQKRVGLDFKKLRAAKFKISPFTAIRLRKML